MRKYSGLGRPTSSQDSTRNQSLFDSGELSLHGGKMVSGNDEQLGNPAGRELLGI